MKRRDWTRLAQCAARVANEQDFDSHRGIYGIEDLDVLCIYDNNPYADDPQRRERELAAFREVLKTEGVKELAFASYPTTGEDAGYTFVMLIDAPVTRRQHYEDVLQNILMRELTA